MRSRRVFRFRLKLALAGFAADEREAQKGEGFRFPDPALVARDGRKTAKLNQPGLVRM
jgi:hypothetical protein